MRAVRGAPPGVEVLDVAEPEGEGELIRVHTVSICASDFNYLRGGSREIMGHEIAGVTESGVPVAVEGIFGCGTCELCLAGWYNRCERCVLDVLGASVPGGMSTWFRAPSRALVPLPDGLDPKNASLVEPTSVAWHTVQMGHVNADTRVAIVGAGAIGLLAGVIAQVCGAPDVAIESRHGHQRQVAEQLGLAPTSGLYDVIIETGGSESSLHRSVELARPGGTMVVVGVHDESVAWPHQAAFAKEMTTIPSLGYATSSHRHGGQRVRRRRRIAEIPAPSWSTSSSLTGSRSTTPSRPSALRETKPAGRCGWSSTPDGVNNP